MITRRAFRHFVASFTGLLSTGSTGSFTGVCRRSDVLSHWRNNAMKRFQGRIPLVNTFGKASLHPVDGTPLHCALHFCCCRVLAACLSFLFLLFPERRSAGLFFAIGLCNRAMHLTLVGFPRCARLWKRILRRSLNFASGLRARSRVETTSPSCAGRMDLFAHDAKRPRCG